MKFLDLLSNSAINVIQEMPEETALMLFAGIAIGLFALVLFQAMAIDQRKASKRVELKEKIPTDYYAPLVELLSEHSAVVEHHAWHDVLADVA